MSRLCTVLYTVNVHYVPVLTVHSALACPHSVFESRERCRHKVPLLTRVEGARIKASSAPSNKVPN